MQISAFLLPRPVLLILAALGVLFAIDLFALAAYRELELASEKLNQRVQTVEALQPLPVMMLEMQSGMRGYVLTGSRTALNRYRAAADRLPGVAQKAAALLVEDERQRQLVEGGAASARDWLARHASPLVVKRGAGDGDSDQHTMTAIAETLHKGQEEGQAQHVIAQFAEAIQIERELVADAQVAVKSKLDRITSWMRWRAVALLLALAALTLMLGRTLANLTGQVRSREAAESATRTSSATLRAMSDASPLGMFLTDAAGACVQSNSAFERIAGLAQEAILGSGWQSTLHPDDRERVVTAWNATTAASTAFASVHRFVHRNGKVVWASMKSARMSDGPRLLGFACSIEDVSERHEAEEALRKSEERLHLALESSRLALFDWHIPSGEVFLSREWNAMTGYGSQDLTTTGRRLNDLVHPDDREALREAFVAIFKSNKPITRTEFRITTRAGQWKRVFCSGRVTERDAIGRAVRLTGTVTAD
jgi:PAS domain S-box-containing protein